MSKRRLVSYSCYIMALTGSVLDDQALLTSSSSSSGHLRTPSAEFGTLPRSPSRALYQV